MSRVTMLYTEYVEEPGGALSSFVLHPCTVPRRKTNRLQGALLRWPTGSDNKQTEITTTFICHNSDLVLNCQQKKNLCCAELVTIRPIPYLHQTSSVLRRSPLEVLSFTRSIFAE